MVTKQIEDDADDDDFDLPLHGIREPDDSTLDDQDDDDDHELKANHRGIPYLGRGDRHDRRRESEARRRIPAANPVREAAGATGSAAFDGR